MAKPSRKNTNTQWDKGRNKMGPNGTINSATGTLGNDQQQTDRVVKKKQSGKVSVTRKVGIRRDIVT